MNFKIVLYFIGWVLKVEAAALLIPSALSLILGEWQVVPWLFLSALIAGVPGFFLTRGKKLRTGPLYAREGYAATSLGWIVMSLIGALPFFLSRRIPNYIDALFETVSGLTTTGASILRDVEAMGYGLNLWRCLMHWIGGMGVLVLILAILPMNGGYHMQVMKAESPGPSVSKMVPKVSDTAKKLYFIYFALTVIMILCYLISGMPVFDAFCMGLGTAGTGGFAVRNSGLADYSTFSQALITIFMILFGINFNVYYLISQKKFKDAMKCEEMRVYLGIIAFSAIFFTVMMYTGADHDKGLYYCFHHSIFQTGALITTTGFSTVDFNAWPVCTHVIILFLMFSGACAGSTGGGFKVSRIMILIREAKKELHMLIHPQSVRIVKLEGKKLDHSIVRSVSNYFVIYVLLIGISVFLISFDRFDFLSGFSSVMSAFNNIGPALSYFGPTNCMADFSYFSKLVLTFDMLTGRLEILPILMLLNKKTWTKHY